jgi:hypothetical protein
LFGNIYAERFGFADLIGIVQSFRLFLSGELIAKFSQPPELFTDGTDSKCGNGGNKGVYGLPSNKPGESGNLKSLGYIS